MSKKMVQTIILSQISKKLPLAEYFAALPKAERRPVIISAPKEDVITAIVEATQRNRHTVRCWMYGYTQPNSMVEKRLWLRSYNQMSQPYFLKERRNDYDWNGILFHS
ncbi:hypothetical protein NXW20_16855 [Bacteroides faecis]|nr:hypothetical protein [Bacteroides faecis]MCS2197173.1 hypothetical protein [Bacteroides faecis]